MTSVLEAMAALRSEDRAAASLATPPPASDQALRLALQLRDIASRDGRRVVLFVPVSRHGDASFAVADAACGLLELRDGPVLIIDLRPEAEDATTPEWMNALADDDELRLVWGGDAGSNTAARWRPLAGRPNKLQYASSPQFNASVEDVRARYRYVLCIGEAAPSAVPTLMMAGLADGVVLSVPPGQTTRTELHDMTAELRRARAKLLGFVVDPRKGQR
jgi:hypothetical protein